mmetsp:Transcript_19941/g.75328  ORF Transcript_19941/g.75328 Transcript_19941/m.75328 type:complete len:287 (+) Transcript_19941:889-1749(+)
MGVGDSGVVADLGVTWSELDVAVPQEPAAQDAPELAILFLVHPIIREHLAGTHDDQPSRLLTLGRRGIPGVSTVEPPGRLPGRADGPIQGIAQRPAAEQGVSRTRHAQRGSVGVHEAEPAVHARVRSAGASRYVFAAPGSNRILLCTDLLVEDAVGDESLLRMMILKVRGPHDGIFHDLDAKVFQQLVDVALQHAFGGEDQHRSAVFNVLRETLQFRLAKLQGRIPKDHQGSVLQALQVQLFSVDDDLVRRPQAPEELLEAIVGVKRLFLRHVEHDRLARLFGHIA